MAAEIDHESEIFWLAFRYVAGELVGDEAEAFERRLDQDQAAREAVAQAVELAGAVATIEPPSRTILPLERRRAVRALMAAGTLAAAACLGWLFVAGRGLELRPGAPVGGAGIARITPAATVVLAWSTLFQERESEKDEPGLLLAASDELPAAAETDDAADSGLPLWLLDAASLAGRHDHPAATAPVKEL